MILYFSGTGNSRYAAKKIAEVCDDEIISINQCVKSNNYGSVSSTKPLVFVGPVYAGRLPRIMNEYIKKVNFSGTRKAYFVVTCAQTPWQTVSYVKKLCEEKEFNLAGFNSIVMPQGYIAGGGTQPKYINDKVLENAKPKIQEIAKVIAKGKKLPKEEKIIHYLLYRATGDEIDEFVHSVDKDRLPFVFRFDESNLRDVIKQIPEDVFEALYKKINLDT